MKILNHVFGLSRQELFPRWIAPSFLVIAVLSLTQTVQAQKIPGLDRFGYPEDGVYHATDRIAYPSQVINDSYLWAISEKDLKRFYDRDDLVDFYDQEIRRTPLRLPAATMTVRGDWKKIAERQNPSTAKHDRTFVMTNSQAVSQEMAHEISVGLAVSATAGVKPFGVGAEVTVETSVGYALTIANSKELGQEWSEDAIFEPGQFLQAWQRQVEVTVEFDPDQYFKDDQLGRYTAEDMFYYMMAETYGPVLWTERVWGSLSYKEVTRRAKYNGGADLYKEALSNIRDGGSSYENRWENLKGLFNYSKFKRMGKIRLVYRLPLPKFHPTFCRVEQVPALHGEQASNQPGSEPTTQPSGRNSGTGITPPVKPLNPDNSSLEDAAPEVPKRFEVLQGNFTITGNEPSQKNGRYYHVYEKELEAGVTYIISARGTVFQPIIVVRTGETLQSTVLGGVTEGGIEPRYFFRPETSGKYYINITSKGVGETGAYSLYVGKG
ncbi:MAG: hypothetical protein KDA78_02330 [Planctomycetaceae bacterium]|nr:hypothetical protein [Planctomycetaceae bacterium]